MFQFSFEVEIDNESPFNKENPTKENPLLSRSQNYLKEEHTNSYKAEEVKISTDIQEHFEMYKLNSKSLNVADISIPHIVTGYLLDYITSNSEGNKDIARAEQKHTDLIPGVYEGGAKIWECTNDVLQYLAKNFKSQDWRNKRILDLGCGAGLLGIYAFRYGANVDFQDYNEDVLNQITIPNVLLNFAFVKPEVDQSRIPQFNDINAVDIENLREKVQFYSGDWTNYAELSTKNVKFDYILTSETIYNPINNRKLLDTIYAKLSDTGVALVAAKTYYFGVGGGLRQFERLVEVDKRFQYKTVWTSTKGVSREILELKIKDS